MRNWDGSDFPKRKEVIMKNIMITGAAGFIGANFAEAQCAVSKSDFIAKVYISQKECNESLYWLTLLLKTGYLNQKQYDSIYADCEELKKLLITITKTARNNNKDAP